MAAQGLSASEVLEQFLPTVENLPSEIRFLCSGKRQSCHLEWCRNLKYVHWRFGEGRKDSGDLKRMES